MAGKKPAKKIGRPRKEIDLDLLRRLAEIQCTDGEIAAVLGIGRSAFYDRKANDPEFSHTLESAREVGKSSLRRLQYDAARKGNAAMLIWLGKQYLGQREPKEPEASDADKPINLVFQVRGDDGRLGSSDPTVA